jgi:hypothetical protein
MSVAFNSSVSLRAFGVTTITTAAFTIVNNPNRAAVMCLCVNPTGAVDSANTNVGGTTGAAIASTDATPTDRTLMWGIKNPPSGSQTAKMTWVTSASDVTLGVIVFDGVDQTTPFNNGTTASAAAGNTHLDIPVTSVNGDMTATCCRNGSGSTAMSSNRTEKWNGALPFVAGTDWNAGDIGPGTGTITHTWTLSSGTTFWMGSGCNVKAAAAAGGIQSTLVSPIIAA